MKALYTILILLTFVCQVSSQTVAPASPCRVDPTYRQFDFWLGNWDVYNLKGKKAGDSKISLILDSCIILEEWSGMPGPGGTTYKGKSFNTYDASTRQWQQHWVDNVGSSTHYSLGKFEGDKITFSTTPVSYTKDSIVVMKLTFFNLGSDKVRQLGEISNNNGNTWSPQYDLEYRRRK
ncbi:MAG: hypothetical protein V4717_19575 [Bacteroidota bacterium]